MPFRIQWHEREGVLEVVYPSAPTAADVDDYARRIRSYIDGLGRSFCCLVDQRQLQVIDPLLLERLAKLNAYAQTRGMRKTARIVSGAMARLQSARLAREAQLKTELRMFEDREEALAWLESPSSTVSPVPDRPSRPGRPS